MNGITLGERLKALRGDKSQADFGKEIGVSQPTIRNYENNKRLPDSEFIKNVCNVYNVTADWLIFGSEPIQSCIETVPKEMSGLPLIEELVPETKGEARPDVRDEYITCLRELADLQRENGDLRVRVTQLEARTAELEREHAMTGREPHKPNYGKSEES